MNFFQNIWAIDLVRFIVYLVVAFVAAGLAQFLVTKLLKLLKLDKKLDKWGVNDGRLGTSMLFVGKLVYIIVFLLFLPSALNALGITSVSGPINSFVSRFIEYLPNIIGAGILLYVGIFIAVLLGQIVSVLLKKTKIDSIIKRADTEKAPILLSDILVKILVSVIVLITIVQALTVLGIDAISRPALDIVYSIFGAIPSVILAVVIVSCGLLVANIACGLLGNVLLTVNFDSLAKKVLPQLKASATKIVVNILRAVIILFVAAQGIEALNLSVLTFIVTAVVAYLPMVIKAAVIALIAYIGASVLESAISKAGGKTAALAKYVKIAIYVLAGFMVLSQLGIATDIVNTAFVITFAAIAIAFAIAFGIGGKDVAKRTLEKAENKCNEDK